MDIIHLLPDSVANQIAAGEVIQRPASVVKELVENAVDAGATEINIVVRDAGRTLIQVVDNGKGMSETDARMAFERHATSKISSASDLNALHTMGFRGEALPSICAVSQLELRTRLKDGHLGTRLVIEGSRVITQDPCGCDTGSNFMVKNLFFNLPARRKFLKSDTTELSAIMREFERLALVNNDIRLTIDTGTSRTIQLPPATFRQRISDIWKNNLNLQLLPVNVDTSLVKISGYVCRPEFARRRNPLQYLIVNGRNMRHPYFHKAIMHGYESLIALDTQPCYFLKFDVDPASIDVNVHPTKNEIKFEYEQEIWRLLSAAVKGTLGQYSAVPSIDFEAGQVDIQPPRPGDTVDLPDSGLDDRFTPFTPAESSPFTPKEVSTAYRPTSRSRSEGAAWNKYFSDFMQEARKEREEEKVPTISESRGMFSNEELNSSSICYQFARKYILTECADGLLVIDQHRAHVKILYRSILTQASLERPVVQSVMFPEPFQLDETQQLILEGIEDEITRVGFSLEFLGDTTWQINGIPGLFAQAPKLNPNDIVMRIIDAEMEASANFGNESDITTRVMENIALTIARGAAIEGGQKLTGSEMEHIVTQLFQLPEPAVAPDGNRVFRLITESEIKSML